MIQAFHAASKWTLLLGGAAACFTGLSLSAPAWAQDAQSEVSQEEAQAIIITGSRLEVRGRGSSPVTTIGTQEIENLGLTSAADIVGVLPQNSQFTGTQNVGAGNFNIGTSLANLRGLNPFFGTRTLTLVDGRRHVPTTNAGAVDLNSVPSVLVGRVETVTGGGSAVYGSEAVAGVVNIILDTRLSGLKAQFDAGLTGRGDGADLHGALGYGTTFADGKGSLIIGGEYNQSDEMRCDTSREICSANYGLFENQGFATNGTPHWIVGAGARRYSSNNGLFPFLNQQFNAAGTGLVGFVPGNYANPAAFFSAQMQGGADSTQDQNSFLTLRPETERINLLAHAEYEFSPSLTGWVEGSWYQNKAQNRQPQTAASFFENYIAVDNVYLPPDVAGFLAGLPPFPDFLPPFLGNPRAFASNGQWMAPRVNDTKIKVWTGAVGLKGAISDAWSWDAYYSYGRNTVNQKIRNLKVTPFFAFALDAIDDPRTPGVVDPICRVTLSNPSNVRAGAGCVPINIFGTGKVSPGAFDYAYRMLVQDETYEQHVVAANIHGDLFSGFGAGAIQVGFGGEYRNETLKTTHDTANIPWYDLFEIYYGEDFSGGLEALEGYTEAKVPLIADVPFIQSLTLEGAFRYSHYRNTEKISASSRTTDFTSWKLSGIWQVNDWLRVRAARSRDVRAGSLFELYSLNITNGGPFGSATNPWAGDVTQQVRVVNGGAAPSLGAEVANTWTVGAVLTGQNALKGVYASLDWYQVDLRGPIGRIGQAQDVVNECFLNGAFCDQLIGTGPVAGGGFTNLTQVNVPNMNLGKFITRGLDMELGYRMGVGASGNLSFRVLGTYLYDLLIDNGNGIVRNYAGVSGPTGAFGSFNTSPKWQANAFITYSDKMFSATVDGRYIGPGKFALLSPLGLPYVAPGEPGYSATDPNSINMNHVNGAFYVNLNGSVKFPLTGDERQTVEFFGQVSNLLDRDPPAAPGGNGYGTNPVYFDTFGRSFRLGVRIRY
jgi:iron complex outermembrane receptor protein